MTEDQAVGLRGRKRGVPGRRKPDVVRDGHRVVVDAVRARIKGRRQQARAAYGQQRAGGGLRAVVQSWSQQAALPAVERPHPDAPVFLIRTAYRIGEQPAVGQKHWEPVRVLISCHVEAGERRRRTAGRGDAVDDVVWRRREDDRAVGMPGAAPRVQCRIGQTGDRTTGNADRLQLSLSEEAERSAVR